MVKIVSSLFSNYGDTFLKGLLKGELSLKSGTFNYIYICITLSLILFDQLAFWKIIFDGNSLNSTI